MNDRDERDPRRLRSAGRSNQVASRYHVVLTLVLGVALVAMRIGHRQALASGDLVVIALVVACLLIRRARQTLTARVRLPQARAATDPRSHQSMRSTTSARPHASGPPRASNSAPSRTRTERAQDANGSRTPALTIGRPSRLLDDSSIPLSGFLQGGSSGPHPRPDRPDRHQLVRRGGVLGAVAATWLYARAKGLNMWAYLDLMTPAGAVGIIGGRLGNIMNGSDTTGRLTRWPIGVTWPEPGQDPFGAFGRVVFGDDLWSGYRAICDLGVDVAHAQSAQLGGEIVRIARSRDPSAREHPPS